MFTFWTHASNSQKCLLIICGYFTIHPTCSIHISDFSLSDIGFQQLWLLNPQHGSKESHPTRILRPAPTTSLRAMTITYRPEGQLNGNLTLRRIQRWLKVVWNKCPTCFCMTQTKKRKLPMQDRLMHCFHHTCGLAECVLAVNTGQKLGRLIAKPPRFLHFCPTRKKAKRRVTLLACC